MAETLDRIALAVTLGLFILLSAGFFMWLIDAATK